MNPRKLEHGFRRISARIPLYLTLRGMRIMMFQLSGFYCIGIEALGCSGLHGPGLRL